MRRMGRLLADDDILISVSAPPPSPRFQMDSTAATAISPPPLLSPATPLPLLALLVVAVVAAALLRSSHRPRPLRRIRTLLRGTRQADPRAPFHADVVLVLGGDRQRELTALALFLARRLHYDDVGSTPAIVVDYDRAPVFVSSGAVGEEDLAAAVAMAALRYRREDEAATAVEELRRRVVFDRRAVCTVTNFTALAPELSRRGARGVLVATSPYHLPRAMGVARLVLGAEGLAVRGVGVPHHGVAGSGGHGAAHDAAATSESWLRRARDLLRAWVWICTGWDGGGFVPWMHPTRRPAPP